MLDSDTLAVTPFSRSPGAVLLESLSGLESVLLSLLLLVELLEGDLADFLFDEGGFSASESELSDDDDPEEEVSSLSEPLLVDITELVSDSTNGPYV